MTFLPIVARELRVAARRKNTYRGRVGAALIPVAVAAFWIIVVASQFSLTQGKLLFSILSTLAFAYCLLAGTRLTSDCLSAEKREGTIGLLFLTDLKGYDVVLGKCVSSSLHAFYGLLAIVPVLALALLLGGITLLEIARMALLFLNALFFSMAAGVLVSALSRNDRRAMFAAGCVIVLVCGGPYLLAGAYAAYSWMRFGRGPQSVVDVAPVLLVSPVFAFQLLRSNVVGPTTLAQFYHSILATHLLSWLLLGIASVIVPRVCRERPASRWRLRWLDFRNRWSYGRTDQRLAFRRRSLDRNAFYWLAARDRIKARYVWFFVGSMILIWGWAGWMLDRFIYEWSISFWVLFLVYLFFKVWLTSEVCTRWVEDRDSGAFELLLSSPLDLKEVARGQSMALLRQFGVPVVLVLILSYLLMQSALRVSLSGVPAGQVQVLFWCMMIMLVADLLTLQWVGMWQAINCSQINRATMAACARVLLLPTVLFVASFGLYLLIARAVSWNWVELDLVRHACLLWLGVGLAINLFFGLRARWCFLHQFRGVATQRFAPTSPGLEPFAELGRALWGRFFGSRTKAPLTTRVRWRSWKRWAIATPLLLLLLPVLIVAWKRHVLEQRLQARLAALRADSQPTSLAELRHWMLPVVPQENAALLFEQAAGQFSFNFRMPEDPSGRRRLEWPGRDAPLSPQFRIGLSNAVARNQGAVELLHQGARRPKSRASIQWVNSPLRHSTWMLGRIAPATEILQYQALHRLVEKDVSGAVLCIDTLLGMARALEQEPFLSAAYFRALYLRAALRVLERILNERSLPDQVLEQLSHKLQAAETSSSQIFARALAGDRALMLEEAFQAPPGTPGWGGPTPTAAQRILLDLQRFTADRLGIRHRDLLQELDSLDHLIANARALGSSEFKLFAWRAVSGANPLPAVGSPWDDAFLRQVDLVASLRAARAALAIERFLHLPGMQLPNELEQLAPRFLRQVPMDPYASGPLRYQRQESGYVIYSVGPDLTDDGAAERTSSNRTTPQAGGHDLVFRVRRGAQR